MKTWVALMYIEDIKLINLMSSIDSKSAMTD